jgi:hypothetical protein
MSKLILGSANFGSEYGFIGNNLLDWSDLVKISQFSLKAEKPLKLDLSYSYSGSFEALKLLDEHNFDGIFKFKIRDLIKYMRNPALEELNDLFISDVNGFAGLLHIDPRENESDAKKVECLNFLKSLSIFRYVGVSVYSPCDLSSYLLDHIQIVQFPFSFIDRRFEKSHLLKEFKNRDIITHARSIFFQGFLVKEFVTLPLQLSKYKSSFDMYFEKLELFNKDPSSFCLSFVLNNKYIDGAIFGIDSYFHFLKAFLIEKNLVCYTLDYEFNLKDEDLLAFNWS